jgi:ATP-dependent Lon protease
MAFIDRLHFYLPGWELPKMRNELFTNQYGFVVDYLAEALREMRKHNFTEISDRYFSLGVHLLTRCGIATGWGSQSLWVRLEIEQA